VLEAGDLAREHGVGAHKPARLLGRLLIERAGLAQRHLAERPVYLAPLHELEPPRLHKLRCEQAEDPARRLLAPGVVLKLHHRQPADPRGLHRLLGAALEHEGVRELRLHHAAFEKKQRTDDAESTLHCFSP
jgi:hypothetical protein